MGTYRVENIWHFYECGGDISHEGNVVCFTLGRAYAIRPSQRVMRHVVFAQGIPLYGSAILLNRYFICVVGARCIVPLPTVEKRFPTLRCFKIPALRQRKLLATNVIQKSCFLNSENRKLENGAMSGRNGNRDRRRPCR